ncbi:hypothetical protein CLA01_42850 [Chryseobacterium lathyri]|uniref:Uncharacterized protein n=2 Tax=Chryseobacterium lathyri TaxID=395933 RepID=A0A511YGB3_9FLAO|nr:hypothetical protein CLA01_42850 [Chryseobacterium lathyri]
MIKFSLMPVSENNHYPTIVYRLDEVKKTFRQYKRKDSHSTGKDYFLPELLRIEKNNGYNTFSGFNHLLRLRDASNWSVCTRHGLRPTGFHEFYFIALFINNAKILCIVYYPKEDPSIEISLFPKFYPCGKLEFETKLKELVQSMTHKKGI